MGEECKFRIEGTDGGLALSFHIEGPSKPMFETCAGKDLSLDIIFVPLVRVSYYLSQRKLSCSRLMLQSAHDSNTMIIGFESH